jgi:hypothetical protein
MHTELPFYVEPTDPPSKQELLKAALKLFARDGVRESSIRAVAAEAGFTKPVVFKSKAVDPTLLVAGFWGLLGQFARLHAFGEWRGNAVDAAPQLELLVWNMLKP